MRFRLLNKIYAHVMSYFWLPCPICNKMFGGHEGNTILMTSWNTGKSVCPDCTEEANRRNKQFMESTPPPIVPFNSNGSLLIK